MGKQTAGLGLIYGNKIELVPKPVTENSPWIVIWGAAGSVGQFAIQVR
jgi:NADPH:quinone reductase-like Zn-dependent oxidoreductase